MLSQDEIDSLLSTLTVAQPAAPAAGGPQPQAGAPAVGASPAPAPAMPNHVAGINMELYDPNQDPEVLKELQAAERLKNFKHYNFKRPDKFSKEHLRSLQSIHDNFSRQFSLLLTTYLRMNVDVDVVSVDQLTYDEFVRSMPRPMTISILEFNPLPGQLLFGLSFEVTLSIIDRMLGGPGTCSSKPRELTDIEASLIKRVIERGNQCLEEAWRSMMNVQVSQIGMEENYSLVQVASSGEIVALITFEVTLGNKDSGLMSLCIPYPVLEGVMGDLTTQHMFNKRLTEEQHYDQEILQKMQFANIPANVILGGTQISLSEFMQLQVGDVIRLDRQATDELLLCVNHKPKFFCRPGTYRNNLAVGITKVVNNPESIKGFCLDDPSNDPKNPNLLEWDGTHPTLEAL